MVVGSYGSEHRRSLIITICLIIEIDQFCPNIDFDYSEDFTFVPLSHMGQGPVFRKVVKSNQVLTLC